MEKEETEGMRILLLWGKERREGGKMFEVRRTAMRRREKGGGGNTRFDIRTATGKGREWSSGECEATRTTIGGSRWWFEDIEVRTTG